jgi:hypothetical protein
MSVGLRCLRWQVRIRGDDVWKAVRCHAVMRSCTTGKNTAAIAASTARARTIKIA